MTTTHEPEGFTRGRGSKEGPTETPWPDDVPPNQDDTWFRYRDDPVRARRMELRIAACWLVAMLCGAGLAWAYIEDDNAQIEGALLFVAFACLGLGMLLWARYLLPGNEITAARHEHGSSPLERAAVVESLERGTGTMLGRRSFLFKVLGPVLGIFGLVTLFPLASLGSRPKDTLFHTKWYKGARLVTDDGTPVRPEDVEVEGVLTVFPEGYTGDAMSQAIVINIGTDDFHALPGQAGFEVHSGPNGIVVFSKVCTHAGCPVSLYNAIDKQLVCPCHQSTFNVLNSCQPVFGPASRRLPQLPVRVDSSGYLVATSDFKAPVGPGFWNL